MNNDKLLKYSSGEIVRLHKEILKLAKGSLEKAITVGRLLTRIKDKLDHGEWLPWLKANISVFSESTAKRYIRCYENRDAILACKIEDVSTAYKMLTESPQIGQSVTDLVPQTTETKPHTESHPKGLARLARTESPAEKPSVGISKSGKTEQPVARLDHIGQTIPEEILADWDRADEVGKRLRSSVSEVKVILEKAIEGKSESQKDIIFRELGNYVISNASGLHHSLGQILPHAVCPKCHGKGRVKCDMCRQRGFVSKHYWDGPAVGGELRTSTIQKYANRPSLSA